MSLYNFHCFLLHKPHFQEIQLLWFGDVKRGVVVVADGRSIPVLSGVLAQNSSGKLVGSLMQNTTWCSGPAIITETR
jgi:hypothetical protein